MTPVEVARAYFDAVRRHDARSLLSLFAPDAELVTPAKTFRGTREIAAFYEAGFSAPFEPVPGPFVCDGRMVAVELEFRAGDASFPVADFFTIDGEQIARLAVYSGTSAA